MSVLSKLDEQITKYMSSSCFIQLGIVKSDFNMEMGISADLLMYAIFINTEEKDLDRCMKFRYSLVLLDDLLFMKKMVLSKMCLSYDCFCLKYLLFLCINIVKGVIYLSNLFLHYWFIW